MIHFLKNVMMAGSLLQIVAFGAGALSVDSITRRPKRESASCRVSSGKLEGTIAQRNSNPRHHVPMIKSVAGGL
jgi:hypothetical protein